MKKLLIIVNIYCISYFEIRIEYVFKFNLEIKNWIGDISKIMFTI